MAQDSLKPNDYGPYANGGKTVRGTSATSGASQSSLKGPSYGMYNTVSGVSAATSSNQSAVKPGDYGIYGGGGVNSTGGGGVITNGAIELFIFHSKCYATYNASWRQL